VTCIELASAANTGFSKYAALNMIFTASYNTHVCVCVCVCAVVTVICTRGVCHKLCYHVRDLKCLSQAVVPRERFEVFVTFCTPGCDALRYQRFG
jgi:hypothetical protein